MPDQAPQAQPQPQPAQPQTTPLASQAVTSAAQTSAVAAQAQTPSVAAPSSAPAMPPTTSPQPVNKKPNLLFIIIVPIIIAAIVGFGIYWGYKNLTPVQEGKITQIQTELVEQEMGEPQKEESEEASVTAEPLRNGSTLTPEEIENLAGIVSGTTTGTTSQESIEGETVTSQPSDESKQTVQSADVRGGSSTIVPSPLSFPSVQSKHPKPRIKVE